MLPNEPVANRISPQYMQTNWKVCIVGAVTLTSAGCEISGKSQGILNVENETVSRRNVEKMLKNMQKQPFFREKTCIWSKIAPQALEKIGYFGGSRGILG